MNDITVVILTLNEELHIDRCLDNVIGWAKKVVVLDSGSTDRTISICENKEVEVVYRKFDNYMNQRNHAISHLTFGNEWMFFLDADEYLSAELKNEINDLFKTNKINDYNGYSLNRKFIFMNQWIKHGGLYPAWFMRLFNPRKATCEREINEHITCSGPIMKLKGTFTDHNLNKFGSWLSKHNKYSEFEATQFTNTDVKSNITGTQSERKQWIRQNVWNKFLPPLIRPFFYFFYSYFIRLGFLDGKIGFIYHFMQGLMYRFIIDIKYIENKMNKNE